nr:Scr1 family TA system antitoxin-like transcriptional regulator [Saccharopolyspora spinosa]
MELAYVEGENEIRYLDDKKALKAHEAAWARLAKSALAFVETPAVPEGCRGVGIPEGQHEPSGQGLCMCRSPGWLG